VAAIVFILGFQRFVCMWEFHQKVVHKANSALEADFLSGFAFFPPKEMFIKVLLNWLK
jgi:hypothetical protein